MALAERVRGSQVASNSGEVVKWGGELGGFPLLAYDCKHVSEKSQEERRNLAKGLGVVRNQGASVLGREEPGCWQR